MRRQSWVDVCHQLFGQGTGVAEDATKEPRTREVSPELQQVRHPLPGYHRVQSDIGVSNVYAFPGQVCVCGQTFGNPYVSGQPLWKYWNCVPSSIMVVHLSPFQGGQDVSHINGGIFPKHFKSSHHFVHGTEGASDLTSSSRNVVSAVREHLLLFSLPFLQMPLKGLTLALLPLLLALLAISGLISRWNKNFFSFGVALASGLPSTMSVQTPAAPHWFLRFPCRGLGTFVPVHRCRGRHSLGLRPHVVAGIHLPSRHW